MTQPLFRAIQPGDPAPWFTQRSVGNPTYHFSAAGGRYLLLCFFHSAAEAPAQAAIAAALARPDLFDDRHAAFFGISTDPADEAEGRVTNRIPGFRFLWDMDLSVSRLYGAAEVEGTRRRGLWVLTDPRLRVIEVIPFDKAGTHVARMIDRVAALPPVSRFAGIDLQAPILYLPDVFEPELCRHLIGLYQAQGGAPSGFMRQVDGKTVGVNDPRHKSRRDITISDDALIRTLQSRITRRVVPEIARAHQFHVTRMERYIVSCYSAEEGGHFAPHRDDTTTGTAHRRFAVSINLNDDFEGGEVSFPEYGPRGFKAMAGGAVVFSCSLLHTVSTVTEGARYAFLPFLSDEAAAKIRAANLHTIDTARDQGTARMAS